MDIRNTCFNYSQKKPFELNDEHIKTKEVIFENKFNERGIRKGWTDESKQAVLDAMETYAKDYAQQQVKAYTKWLRQNNHLLSAPVPSLIDQYFKSL